MAFFFCSARKKIRNRKMPGTQQHTALPFTPSIALFFASRLFFFFVAFALLRLLLPPIAVVVTQIRGNIVGSSSPPYYGPRLALFVARRMRAHCYLPLSRLASNCAHPRCNRRSRQSVSVEKQKATRYVERVQPTTSTLQASFVEIFEVDHYRPAVCTHKFCG